MDVKKNPNFSTINFDPKNIYICQKCNFSSKNKKDYKRHLNTKKHKNTLNNCNAPYICLTCGKSYTYASGLSKHKKKCINIDDSIVKKTKKTKIKNNIEKITTENNELKDMIKELISTQKELLQEYTNKNQVTNNTINNNNTYNKMSINIFLNEKCKHAMNLTDFVNQIRISVADLEYTKDNGFAKGISNILTKQLQDLNPTERPIHCSDKKRLQFYVKDEGKWEKDKDHKKIDKSIQNVQKAQIQKMYDWEQNHPGWKQQPKLVEEWSKIVHGLTGSGEKSEKSNKEIKRMLSSHIDVKNELVNK